MKRLRAILFWMHLSVALAAGLVVVVMAATGASLAFEHEVLAWAERDGTAGSPTSDDVLARVATFHPGTPVTAVTFQRDGARVSLGRDAVVWVAGDGVGPLPGQGWRDFFRLMNDWHRALGATGEGRATGRAVTGAANAAFLFLALSGLYLWWPRAWTGRALRASLWFRRGLGGKARDWNWHNVIGFWSLPVLLVVTTSGLVISYRWAGNLVYRLAGEAPPAGPGLAPPVTVRAAPGAQPLSLEALVETARRELPGWLSITWRQREGRGPRTGGTPATVLLVREAGARPRFASTQLSLDPFTGQVLRREAFADASAGRKARSWLRFLHTGEALGWPGQLLVGIASLGAVMLAWTGFSLAWRRFFRRRAPANGAG
jgi:uncharacterized iron-regulated membrane protein